MTTEIEHLLVCLNEECVEVAKRCDKALRFGLDDTDPTIPGAPTERARIFEELQHVIAVFEMLTAAGALPLALDRTVIDAKKEKVLRFMEYARNRGALSLEL